MLIERYLEKRGLDAACVQSLGWEIDTELDLKLFRDRLNDNLYHAHVEEILWIPIKGTNGHIISWIIRLLPDAPGAPRFLCAKGSGGFPYLSAKVFGLSRSQPLIITEGPIKAETCDQAGVAAIGLNGVWGASPKAKDGTQIVLWPSIIENVDLRQRKVYIAFDADAQSNADVRAASIRLLFLLYAAGAHVFQLTSWDVSEGKGIDDFLVAVAAGSSVPEEFFPPQSPGEKLQMLINDAVPFLDTLQKIPTDLEAVGDALSKVALTSLCRDQLCKMLAPKLGVQTASLRQIGQKTETNTIVPPLSEPWSTEVAGEELLNEICTLVERHIVMGDFDLVTTALWVPLSYLHDLVDTLPMLAITSPIMRCGKTRLLTILSRLVRQALACSNISPSSVFRVVEKYSPTLLIDEAETFLREHEELRGIINSGHTRGAAYVIRTNPNTMEPEKFSTWAPKVIALIGKLTPTLVDRSFTICMMRRGKDKIIRPLRDTPSSEFEELQRKLVRWTNDIRLDLTSVETALPKTLNDRAAENWLPLLAIAKCAGPTWFQLALDAAERASQEEDGDEDEIKIRILRILKEHDDPHIDFLPTADIIQVLNKDIEAPWMSWRTAAGGCGMVAEKLSRILRDFHVRSQRNQNLKGRPYGYWRKDLLPLFEHC
jgi:hypothetical protein